MPRVVSDVAYLLSACGLGRAAQQCEVACRRAPHEPARPFPGQPELSVDTEKAISHISKLTTASW